MRGSDLDRRITIEHKQVEQHPGYGTEVITWAPFASRIAAQVQDTLPSKSEAVKQGLTVASRPARIRFRFRNGITSDMRVIVHSKDELTNRTLQITAGPAEIGRREWVELVCEEYSTGGTP